MRACACGLLFMRSGGTGARGRGRGLGGSGLPRRTAVKVQVLRTGVTENTPHSQRHHPRPDPDPPLPTAMRLASQTTSPALWGVDAMARYVPGGTRLGALALSESRPAETIVRLGPEGLSRYPVPVLACRAWSVCACGSVDGGFPARRWLGDPGGRVPDEGDCYTSGRVRRGLPAITLVGRLRLR
jgi:hypothetical protein